jgi:hypothetical protein
MMDLRTSKNGKIRWQRKWLDGLLKTAMSTRASTSISVGCCIEKSQWGMKCKLMEAVEGAGAIGFRGLNLTACRD